jgi:hypothetical protein
VLGKLEKVVVFGGGSFGTAMAVSLARQKKELQVGGRVWAWEWEGGCGPTVVMLEASRGSTEERESEGHGAAAGRDAPASLAHVAVGVCNGLPPATPALACR